VIEYEDVPEPAAEADEVAEEPGETEAPEPDAGPEIPLEQE
jgi:hypothetical protein